MKIIYAIDNKKQRKKAIIQQVTSWLWCKLILTIFLESRSFVFPSEIMRRKIEKEKEKDELANDCCDRKTLYSHSEFCSRKVFRDPGVEIRLSFGNFHSRILRSSSTLVAGLSADSELLRILFQRSDQSEKAVGASITVQRKEILVHDSLCPPLEKPITKKEARYRARVKLIQCTC